MNTIINPELLRRFQTISQATNTELLIYAPCDEGQQPEVSSLLIFGFLEAVIPKIHNLAVQQTHIDHNYLVGSIRIAAETHLLTSTQFGALLDALSEEERRYRSKPRSV